MLEFPLLCRLCGSKTENGLYIYCDEGKRRQVETKIRLYLHFQVLPSDSLPKKICASCFEELEGMHRFAINALKVQDHLSRLSKELPLTAIDICKTFMSNYVHEPVVVNDTIASLTSQEVTEMEVQVDPMVFLEDDQIEDCTQDSISQGHEIANEPVNNSPSELPQNGENSTQEKEHNSAPDCPEKDSQKFIHLEEEKISTTVPNEQNKSVQTFHQEKDLSKQATEESQVETELAHSQQNKEQHQSTENKSEEKSGENGSPTEPSKNMCITLQEAPALQLSGQKKCKKSASATATRSIKKLESRSTPTENIKCTTYTCPICKKVLMKKALFKSHLEVHKTDHKFACEICMRVFKKEVNLIRHRKSHAELTTFPCAHCNRVYPTKSTLRSHLVSHSDERPHVCNICSKSFKRNQDLKFHLNQHNGLRPYRCPYCTKAFASSGNCFSHRRRAHMPEIERDRALRKSAAAVN